MGHRAFGGDKNDAIPLCKAGGTMMTLAEIEEAAIDYALLVCPNRMAAADALGLGRATLYRKIAARTCECSPGIPRPN